MVTLKVLLQRMRGKRKGEISEEQFGFMQDKGTRYSIFTLRMITERCVKMQKGVYICFVDCSKAFDKVQHATLFEILQELDVNGKDVEQNKESLLATIISSTHRARYEWLGKHSKGYKTRVCFITRTVLTIHRDDNEENRPHGWSKNRRDQCK